MNIKQYYINRIIALENKHQQIISLICRLKIRKVEFLIGNSNYIPDEEDIEALREYFKSKAKNVNKELEQVKEKFVKADCLEELKWGISEEDIKNIEKVCKEAFKINK